jgi:4-alpha-glucanotransferase
MSFERLAGVVLPLFSLRTRRDWGIGQISDLPVAGEWIREAGHRLLQILPPHELSPGETSPYGALTAFGLDPIYIDLEAVPDLDGDTLGILLGPAGRDELTRLRQERIVDYAGVRALKGRVLRGAFERFYAQEWERDTPRARELAAFQAAERMWLDDLALYTALREDHGGYGWETWPEEERDRAPHALERVRREHAVRLLEVAYQQWIALGQWDAARERLRAMGVELMGDLPFVVCGESSDVWARASQFQRHLSLGVPPDAFSEDGQDWGLPPYDWLAMESDDLAWVRARTRHAMRLYDRFRLDHVVGYFRQWTRPRGIGGPQGRFDPDDEDAQRARGRRVLGTIVEEARRGAAPHAEGEGEPARAIAEDLGIIPPFVRETLADLGMPGYRVIPWEKDGNRFRDPQKFPPVSVACWSTHDTAPISAWWDEFTAEEHAELTRLAEIPPDASTDETRSMALLRALFRAGSGLTLVLAQEVLAVRDRINTPGTVGGENWRYRLARPIEELREDPGVIARLDGVRRLVEESGRG